MRSFIVLCLVTYVCADKLGYNYQPVGHSDSGLSFAPGSSIGGNANLGLSLGGGSNLGNALGGGSNLGQAIGGSANLGPAIGGGNNLGNGLGGNDNQGSVLGGSANLGPAIGSAPESASVSAPAEIEKQFYTYSAPEADFDDANAAQQALGSVKQGIRVVFIKGPENKGLEDAALALAKQSAQQKTAIYILNKQADIGDLANKLNSIGKNANTKPEVHFVKYRTPEDAANAQKAIQSQYDSLGGQSASINGGVAPVLNFASQAPVQPPTAQAPQNAYLPSSVFRRF